MKQSLCRLKLSFHWGTHPIFFQSLVDAETSILDLVLNLKNNFRKQEFYERIELLRYQFFFI